jgi:hypothetical protein
VITGLNDRVERDRSLLGGLLLLLRHVGGKLELKDKRKLCDTRRPA